MQRQCCTCGAPATKACTGCLVTAYCSVECQGKDWSQHAQICGHLNSTFLRAKRHRKMQRLMSEHVFYTYMVIVAIGRDLDADLTAHVARLLQNQDDIGRFLGKLTDDVAFGDSVAGLLKEHIVGAKELLDARKAGKSTVDAGKRWYANGAEIAELLGTKDPQGKSVLRRMFTNHLDQTLQVAGEVFRGRPQQAIVQLDRAQTQMHAMGQRLVEVYYQPRT